MKSLKLPQKNLAEFFIKSNSIGEGYKIDLRICPLKEVNPTLTTRASTLVSALCFNWKMVVPS